MKHQNKQPPKGILSTCVTGALGAVIIIPFLPIILPLILLYYFGLIIGIIKRGQL